MNPVGALAPHLSSAPATRYSVVLVEDSAATCGDQVEEFVSAACQDCPDGVERVSLRLPDGDRRQNRDLPGHGDYVDHGRTVVTELIGQGCPPGGLADRVLGAGCRPARLTRDMRGSNQPAAVGH